MPAAAASRPLAFRELLALVAIIALGCWVRLDDLGAYRHDAASQFVDGEPLLLNPDGYYFLGLSRDLLEGTYAPVDRLRGAPTGAPRPSPPPLLSLLTAGIHQATSLPLGWAAAILPALLGPLLALPVFAVGRRLCGAGAGLAAALVAVLSHYYVYRTAAGFHDTDALNVTLAMALAGWGLGLATVRRERFAAWLAAGAALFALYLWWWQGAYGVVTVIALWSLATGMAFRPGIRRERLLAAGAVITGCGLAVALAGVDAPRRLFEHLAAVVRHVTKADAGDFPNVAESIGEQVPAALSEAAAMTLGDPVLLAFAVAGAAGLLLRHRRAALLLLPVLALAAAGFVYAQRFVIFAAPVTGLGIGMLTAWGIAAARGRRGLTAAVALGVAAAAAPSLHRGLSIDFTPELDAERVSSMRWLEQNTPPDALVWAAWDHGYALRYWSRRATVSDGSVHDGETAVYAALPFAAPGFALAANFMQFYSVHGQPGMQRIHRLAGDPAAGLALAREVFAGGPRQARALLAQRTAALPADGGLDAWLAFLFPDEAPPIYLVMDQRMLRSARWWFEYGTWNARAPAGPIPRLEPFAGLRASAERITGPRIDVDLAAGTARLADGTTLPLSRVVTATTRGLREQRYPQPGPEFHLHALDGVGVLQDPALARTVFNQAFILRTAEADYLQPAHILGTRSQVWRVRGASR